MSLPSPNSPPNPRPMLSLVVPMMNEADGIEIFMERVLPVLKSVTPNWEIICVNDGSNDDTLTKIKALAADDTRIKYLSLSRNFGKEAALSAGLHHAHGEAVIPIDADLQDPPEIIPQMIERWQSGVKVVLATRKTRAGDSWIKQLTARGFYHLIDRITRFDIPANTGDFRLMDASVVDVIRLLPERTRFMKGLFAWVGFRTEIVYFDREPRAVGQAKQSYRRLWQLAKDGILSFTTIPLRFSTYLGALISLVSFSYAAFLIGRTVLFGTDVPGYTSIMVAVLCMGGIQLLSLGILGGYVGRIYRESKHRPLYVIEEKGGL